MRTFDYRMTFAPDEPPPGGPGDAPPANNDSPDGERPKTFEAWLEAQPEDVRGMYASHTEGLRNTVKATRDERDTLKAQIKDLSKTLEEGSDAKKRLDEISSQLDEANRKADFFEMASRPGVGLLDVGAAWLVAKASGDTFIDSRGNIRLDALKEQHPALFGKAAPPAGHAGSGRDAPAPSTKSMDDFIRSQAGRS